jgi:hypothetical protein
MVGRTRYLSPLPRDLAGTDHCSSEEYRFTHEYRIDVCRVTRGAHIEHFWLSKNLFYFSYGCEQFH